MKRIVVLVILAACLCACEKKEEPNPIIFIFEPFSDFVKDLEKLPDGYYGSVKCFNNEINYNSDTKSFICVAGLKNNHLVIRTGKYIDNDTPIELIDELMDPEEFIINEYLGYGEYQDAVFNLPVKKIKYFPIYAVCNKDDIVAILAYAIDTPHFWHPAIITKNTREIFEFDTYYPDIPISVGNWYGNTFSIVYNYDLVVQKIDIYNDNGEMLYTSHIFDGEKISRSLEFRRDNIDEYEIITHEIVSTEMGLKLLFKQVNAQTGTVNNVYEYPSLWTSDAKITVKLVEKTTAAFTYSVDSITYDGTEESIMFNVPISR